MKRTQILDALNASAPCDDIRICGWVRTRRDAKGFSFLELNDGSCLTNIQVIVDEETDAYRSVGEATTGASVDIRGQLVESPGKGQKWEVRAATMTLLGKADPETFPLQKKTPFRRIPAHHRASASAHQQIWRRVPHPRGSKLRGALIFPRKRLFQRAHAHSHRFGL